MRAVSFPLGEYVGDKIFYGIKTGFNEAFVIDRHLRDELIAIDPKSAEIIKPFLLGEDVKRYKVDYKQRYIILSKIGTPIEQYPAIFAHLQKYQAQLEKRWDKGNHWWELRACDYYKEFERPKIIFPDIARRCQFALDTEGYFSGNTTYLIPIDESQKYLVPLLNSSLIEFFFWTISAFIRGGYLRFFTQYVTQIPVRRITFTTPTDERIALTNEGTALYKQDKHEELLILVEYCLAHQPEQSDIIHDLLVYLAEGMLNLHKQKQGALENFIFGLESVLSTSELQRIERLWTPPGTTRTAEQEAGKHPEAQEAQTEAEERLGRLSKRPLELRDDIGLLNEDQWKWLLKRRLSMPDLVNLVRLFRQFQPPIVALDRRIATTDSLINQVVYRLYGLTAEEVEIVERERLS